MSVTRKQFQSYFAKLESLSVEALDRSAQKLVRTENESTARLIAHLAEMSERKTALEMGFSSLYDYCIRRLNLSEGAVPARVQVANVCRRFPELLAALADGRVSLTVAGLLAPHVTVGNASQLISDCAGKSRRQAEEYLVALRPKSVFKPSIRKRPPPRPTTPALAGTTADLPRPSRPIVQPARVDTFNFRFSAGREFKDKLDRLAEVLGVEQAQNHMAVIMEKALDIALDKRDPAKKFERRRKRAAARRSSPRPDEISTTHRPAVTRHVPEQIVEQVFERGGYRCEFRASDGKRCSSRSRLQVDHLKPFAVHRSHDERFLRLLCPAHNRLAAERFYGEVFVQDKIEQRRKERAP